MVEYSLPVKGESLVAVYLLGFLEGEGEVVSPVLCLQTVPVKVVWVEDVDQRAEGQAIVPTRGEVSHWNLNMVT